MNLIFLDYNTYGNRIVKKESSLTDYLTYETARETSANFNPNDGIDTVQVLNNSTHDVGNYLIVADSEGNIESRWFVMESIYKRNGQHFVKLHRDLMVDYWEGIKSAPCFIEKATVSDTDSAIFNKENMTFNQIKTSETPLKDETGCAWVVGYIPKDALNNNTIHGDVILEYTADYEYTTLSDFPLYDFLDTYYNGPATVVWYHTNIAHTESNNEIVHYDVSYSYNSKSISGQIKHNISSNNTSTLTSTYATSNTAAYESIYSNFDIMSIDNPNVPISGFEPYTNYSGNIQSNPTIDQYLSYQNKVIKIAGNYFRINIEKELGYGTSDVSESSAMGLAWNTVLDKTYLSGKTPNSKSFYLTYHYDAYYLTLEQLFTDATVTIDNTRYHLEDQPYDMFCIPYSNDLEIYKNGTKLFDANKSIAVNMAIAIGQETGSANVYDVQLLPYCPVRYMIKSDGTFDIGDARVHYIKDGNNNNIGVICWATTSAFTLDIPYTISISDVKLENECDLYRLSSPNFNGQFEFSPAKNGGVTSFNVDCNYKPFNPYIHVNPNFGRLYGQDYNDARGLICGGDFSLPQLSNAWANYQLQNKNYQEIFDRQIQNMEVNNSLANIKSAIGVLGNAVGSGLATGNVGIGVGSAISGAVDIGLQVAQQQETLDYTKDLFGYQLGNIKAIPTNLTKTTAFTYNNKIFPILEYYTCTEEEKQALRDKIKYNGMTVMRIGKIEDYIQAEPSYIKGQLIRLQVNEDNHLLEAIRQEVNKGVYV